MEWPWTNRTTTLARSTGCPPCDLTTMLILVMGALQAATAERRSAANNAIRMAVPRVRIPLDYTQFQAACRRPCYTGNVVPAKALRCGGATDSTGLNRGGEACRVPSSR